MIFKLFYFQHKSFDNRHLSEEVVVAAANKQQKPKPD